MTILDRLKLELNNKDYFSDDDYIVFLTENNLGKSSDIYTKETMQKKLLFTVIDILESVSNDIDKMRKVQTEFETTDGAYAYISKRIKDIKERISTIPDSEDTLTNNVSKFFGSRW